MAAAAAAPADASRSGASADSYIGSLISLTSKCEIRYEGILYNINTEESSIGLRNVRSFGTEGRKKDGPQIPPSDKVYEYILFRGSDIKDLQVKSTPPAQPAPPPQIHNDPAIIQSHYPRSASTSTSVLSQAVPDISSHSGQIGIPRAPFQDSLPLYQPGGSLGTWGSSPPNANGSGLGMPMYWQGFYPPSGLPSGAQPHLQQSPLLCPPPGLSIPHAIQQPLQYPGMNPSLPSGPQNLTGLNVSVASGSLNLQAPNAPMTLGLSVPELPSSLLPPVSGTLGLSSTTLPSTVVPPTTANVIVSEMPSSMLQNKPPITSLPVTTLTSSLPFVTTATTKVESISATTSKPRTITGLNSSYQAATQPPPSAIGLTVSSQGENTKPSLVTPGQLLQAGPSSISTSQPSQTVSQQANVKVISSDSPKSSEVEVNRPILPLPTPLDQKPNGTPHNYHRGRGRGRGRGNGYSRPLTKFSEDFDFTAMNEKFKKEEVWGHLGKQVQPGEKEGDFYENYAYDYDVQDDDAGSSKTENKSVYVKDDFFDTLSCNSLDHGNNHARTKFSEQMKLDTETFGEFPRYRGRGGRGFRGGRTRGSYYGRGYGYVNRGRGPPNRPM